jgi:hypothetical protein
VVADSAEEPLLPGRILLRPIQAASPRRNGCTSALGQKIDWQEAQESRPKETDELTPDPKHEHGGD